MLRAKGQVILPLSLPPFSEVLFLKVFRIGKLLPRRPDMTFLRSHKARHPGDADQGKHDKRS